MGRVGRPQNRKREDMETVERKPDTQTKQEVQEKSIRLSVNMNPETADALREIAKNHGVSITEAVRRAIAVASFIEEESRKGNSIQIEDAQTKKVRELVLM